MVNKEIVTVDYLLEVLKIASENGFGDMKFKCIDGFLHTDEISGNYTDRLFQLNGMIFNTNTYEKMIKFCCAVEQAKSEFLNT